MSRHVCHLRRRDRELDWVRESTHIHMNSVGLPAFLEAVVSNAFINEAGQSLPSLAEQCTSLLAASHRQGLTNRLAPDQDGCRVDCCWLPAAEVPFAVNMPVDRMN